MESDNSENFSSLTYDEIFDILDNYEEGDENDEEHPVVAVVAARIQHYSALASKALEQGKDYLPLLTATKQTAPLDAVAMELVLEILEDELEEA